MEEKNMAMMNCPECGRKISDEARTCPECGWENKMIRQKDIKRGRGKSFGIAAIIIGVLLLIFGFAATAAWGDGDVARANGLANTAFILIIGGAVVVFLNRKK